MKREEIKKFISKYLRDQFVAKDAPKSECDSEVIYILKYLRSQGVVIKVDRGLPYEWGAIRRKHSYHPYNMFITYTLKDRRGRMFGYIQRYQSPTEDKYFKKYALAATKPVCFTVYKGNEERAYGCGSESTLKEAKEMLIKKFLSSESNPDRNIPDGYAEVEKLI